MFDRGIQVLHSDIKKADGVDLVGDIMDEGFRKNLKEYDISSIICSNMLEHVYDRETICKNITDALRVNGIIIVTVPYKYPKHLDPIDTMFRPSPKNVALLFDGTELLNDDVVTVGKPITSLLKSPSKLLFLLFRSLVPFYKYAGWITCVNKVMFLFKTRSVSCVVLKKIR